MKFYTKKEKLLFIMTIVVVVIDSLLTVYFAKILQKIIDAAVSTDFVVFKKTILMSIAYVICAFLVAIILNYSKQNFIKHHIYELRSNLVRGVLNSEKGLYFGELNILINNVNMYRDEYIKNLFGLFTYVPMFIFSFILLYQISVTLLVIVIALSVLPVIFSYVVKNSVNKQQEKNIKSLSILTDKIREMIDGISTIKGFGAEKNVENNIKSTIQKNQEEKYKFNILVGNISSVNSFLGSTVFTVVIALGAYFSMKGVVTIGVMISAIQLMNYIVNPFVNSSKMYNEMNAFKSIKNELNLIASSAEMKKTARLLGISNFKNSIELSHINFSYDSGDSAKTVLKNVNFTFHANKKYAIVGESGSGKSTILKLVSGAINPDVGEIYYDGVERKQLKNEFLYKNISTVQQDIFLFNDSIRNNITFYNEYSLEKVNHAISFSELSQYVEGLENGLSQFISGNGENLSGGEKQRISIARAMIQDTPVLILDEFTSAIDTKTASKIEKRVIDLNKTILSVTHRMDQEILSLYDQILVIKNGEIFASGTFDELIENCEYFKGLYYLAQ